MTVKYSSRFHTDNEIISTFVNSFVEGKSILLSNQNLRTESLFDQVQLIAKKGGVISTAALKGAPITAKLYPVAPYFQLVNQAMAENCYYPLTKDKRGESYIYQYLAPSKDYQVYCTTAKELWKVCWRRDGRIRAGIPLEFVIWGQGPATHKQTWHPIRGMDFENCKFFVTILAGTIECAIDELVIWARKRPTHELSNCNELQQRKRLRAGMRGYLSLRR